MKQSNPSFLSILSSNPSYRQIQSSFTNRTKLNDFRKQLFNRIVKLYPELKQKETKKLLNQQLEDLVGIVEEEGVLAKLLKIFKLQDEVGKTIKEKVERIKSKEKQESVERVILKETKEQRDPKEIYLRLTAMNPSTIRFMVKYKRFPRLQIKLNDDHHLKQVEEFLKKKWIGGFKADSYDLILYPELEDGTIYLDRLNKFLLMTDILYAFNWQEPNVMTFKYQIVEKPKIQITSPLREEKPVLEIDNLSQKQKKHEQIEDNKDLNIKAESEEERIPNNVFSFNQNSMDINQGLFSFYNSLDFQFMMPQSRHAFNEGSLAQQIQRGNSNSLHLESVRQSIQKVKGDVDEDSFKPVNSANSNGNNPVLIPSVKRKTGNE